MSAAHSERKLAALEIIFSAPLWPCRRDLSAAGRRLYDRIKRDAKPYALLVVDREFGPALKLAATWAPLVNALIDGERIADSESAQKLLAVFKHYCDAIADFGKIERRPGPLLEMPR